MNPSVLAVIFRQAPGVVGEFITVNGWPTKGYSGQYADGFGLEGLCVL